MKREHRVAGAVIGSAVGDALGAPFEFGPPNQFSTRFPTAARGTSTEMCGGGAFNWLPGEFTDHTQMELVVADSLVRRGGLDEADICEGFKAWAEARMSP
ncbi:MAG: ADP-ribosylglycohydrolase family protein [Chthoniobacterales bacterium]|nr:ADP-ribosylglycohydrolase family protein [Chthoniobacterales bacterium]